MYIDKRLFDTRYGTKYRLGTCLCRYESRIKTHGQIIKKHGGDAHLWLTLCNLTPSHHVDKFALRYVATLNNDVRLDDLAIKSEGL